MDIDHARQQRGVTQVNDLIARLRLYLGVGCTATMRSPETISVCASSTRPARTSTKCPARSSVRPALRCLS